MTAPNAVLITKPNIDFNTLLGLSSQLLGYSPAHRVDEIPFVLSDTQRFLECLAAVHSEEAEASGLPYLLSHVSFSVLAVADTRDMLDILQDASGMPFVVSETEDRAAQLAVITGTLAQWKVSVKSGMSMWSTHNVRVFFNRVMAAFQASDIDVWRDCERRPMADRTLYLEDKR